MEIDKQPFKFLAEYLSGNISGDDKIAVEKWINDSAENRQFFDEARKIWKSSGVRLLPVELDSQQLFHDLKARIDQEQKPVGRIISWFRPYGLHVRIAAGICLLLASYLVIREVASDDSVVSDDNIVIESLDQVATVYLPDSTKVWLNVNSSITYSRQFQIREITLAGEAFLAVRKDTTDFTVATQHTKVHVLGTAFNIKEQEDSTVILTVAQGAVNFSTRESETKEPVVVKAKQKAVFKKQKIQRSQNNDPAFASWRARNNPVFEKEKNNPGIFLANHYTWRKNRINQSVIEGSLRNNAGLAAYNKIILEVTYTKPGGRQVTVDVTVNETVLPGKSLAYQKRLLDILTDTKSITIKVKSANVTSENSY
jgi:ferric-dicitrate binding protein FerR (iron transport regulator)